MKKMRTLVTLGLALTMVFGLAGTARAAVEDAIPQDAFLVIKAQDLGGAYDRLMNGSIVAQLRNPAFTPEAAEGLRKLDEGLATLKQQQGVDLVRSLKDIFGKECALAVFGEKSGVLVAEAGDATALQQAIENVQKLEQNKQASPTTSQYRGVTIYTQPKGEKINNWAITGRFFILSEQREAVEKAIDTATGVAPAFSRSTQYAEAMRTVEPGALVTAYLDMAPLQARMREVQAAIARQPMDPGRLAALNRLSAAADSMRYVVGAVREDNGLSANVTAVFKDGRIPAGLAAILPPRGSRLEILDAVPDSAVLAIARNVNVQGVWNSLLDFVHVVRPEAAQRMQTGIVSVANALGGIPTPEQLFSELGTQAVVMVLPSADPNLPPSAAVCMRLNDTSHIPVALQSLLGAVLMAPEMQRNASLETAVYNGVTMKIVHILRPGPLGKLSPTLALIGKDLTMATSSDAVRMLVDSAGRGHVPPASGSDTVFVSGELNVPQVAALVAQYRELLVRNAVQKEGKTEGKARADIAGLEKVLAMFERAEWTASFGDDRLDFSAAIRIAPAR